MVEPAISRGDADAHFTQAMLLMRIFRPLGLFKMSHNDIENGVHSPDMGRCKSNCSAGEPWLFEIIAWGAEQLLIRRYGTLKVYDMAAGSPHSERVPPRPVDFEAGGRHDHQLPPLRRLRSNEGVVYPFDTAGKVLFPSQNSVFQRNCFARDVSVPNAEQFAARRQRSVVLLLSFGSKQTNKQQCIDVSLKDACDT